MKKNIMKNRTLFISLSVITTILIVIAAGMKYTDRYKHVNVYPATLSIDFHLEWERHLDKVLLPITRNGEFTSIAWERYPHLRYRMIEDMERQIDFQDLSRGEIVGIPGLNEAFEYGHASIKYRICGSRRAGQAYWVVISKSDEVEFFGIGPWS